LSLVFVTTIQVQTRALFFSFNLGFPKFHPFTICLFFLAFPHIMLQPPMPTSCCNLQLINQWKDGVALLKHGLLQTSLPLPLF
jgi:hypothetical protein